MNAPDINAPSMNLLTMSSLQLAIANTALAAPTSIALQGSTGSLTYAQLAIEIKQLSKVLMTADAGTPLSQPAVIGLAMDNDPAWAVIDIAALELGLVLIPLPYFFSPAQIQHAIEDAGIRRIISDQPILIAQMLAAQGKEVISRRNYQVAGKLVSEFFLADFSLAGIETAAQVSLATGDNPPLLPANTVKVTYTSGTTGNPKGVCLDSIAMLRVAASLKQVTDACPADRHLSILPLSTLLENIAGLYVPLLAGATTILLPALEVGLSGASGLNVGRMMAAIVKVQATTLVLTPELLKALIMAVEAGMITPETLRFVAVGGASVSPRLLQRASALGLPVFEGYGLSECASVVALNTGFAYKRGSVGKPLPHVRVQFADDGEILVAGACMLAYSGMVEADNGAGNQVSADVKADLNDAISAPPQLASGPYIATGDIGHLDEDGYLHVTARKKNMFITSYGRNVAPEWVERELQLSPYIAQAAIFGEALPWNTALIVPARDANPDQVKTQLKSGLSHSQLELLNTAIAEVNASLPDYARVTRWIIADAPFTVQNGQLTANGRLKRAVIWSTYAAAINRLYIQAAGDDALGDADPGTQTPKKENTDVVL